MSNRGRKMLKVDTMRINDYFQQERMNGIFVIMDLIINAPS